MYVRYDESSLLFPGLTMSTATTGTSLQECGIIKTMHTGFSAYVLHYANAPVLTRKKPGRYDLMERFV